MSHTLFLTTGNPLRPPSMAHSQDSPHVHQPPRTGGTQAEPVLILSAKDARSSQLCPRHHSSHSGGGEAGGRARDLFKGLGGGWLPQSAPYRSSLHHWPACPKGTNNRGQADQGPGPCLRCSCHPGKSLRTKGSEGPRGTASNPLDLKPPGEDYLPTPLSLFQELQTSNKAEARVPHSALSAPRGQLSWGGGGGTTPSGPASSVPWETCPPSSSWRGSRDSRVV